MHQLIKEIYFDNSLKEFRLAAPSGAVGGYHVYIDNFYNGSLFFRNGEWVGMMNDKCKLKDLQCKKLGAMIDKDLKQKMPY